jgi:hypothetical protein
MPISRVARSESPDDTVACYAPLHLSIVGYIDIVIIVDELVISYLPIYQEHSSNQNKANVSFSPHNLISSRANPDIS